MQNERKCQRTTRVDDYWVTSFKLCTSHFVNIRVYYLYAFYTCLCFDLFSWAWGRLEGREYLTLVSDDPHSRGAPRYIRWSSQFHALARVAQGSWEPTFSAGYQSLIVFSCALATMEIGNDRPAQKPVSKTLISRFNDNLPVIHRRSLDSKMQASSGSPGAHSTRCWRAWALPKK